MDAAASESVPPDNSNLVHCIIAPLATSTLPTTATATTTTIALSAHPLPPPPALPPLPVRRVTVRVLYSLRCVVDSDNAQPESSRPLRFTVLLKSGTAGGALPEARATRASTSLLDA